jgi:hypothetical protein
VLGVWPMVLNPGSSSTSDSHRPATSDVSCGFEGARKAVIRRQSVGVSGRAR